VRPILSRRTLTEPLLTVAGANRDVLREAPKERGKQVAMGAVLVCTAGLAAVSASYALHLALHLWVPVAIVGGLVWGLVILNLDRWLVVSTPRLKSTAGTLAMALPRVVLAVLIGAVVSTPLTLAVFEAEIDTEVQVMAAEAEDEFNQRMQDDSRTVEMEAGQPRLRPTWPTASPPQTWMPTLPSSRFKSSWPKRENGSRRPSRSTSSSSTAGVAAESPATGPPRRRRSGSATALSKRWPR
jgi:hypothetical protein